MKKGENEPVWPAPGVVLGVLKMTPGFWGSRIIKNFRYLKWRNPEPEIRLCWGWVFPYISRIHTCIYRFSDEPSILGTFPKCLVTGCLGGSSCYLRLGWFIARYGNPS